MRLGESMLQSEGLPIPQHLHPKCNDYKCFFFHISYLFVYSTHILMHLVQGARHSSDDKEGRNKI